MDVLDELLSPLLSVCSSLEVANPWDSIPAAMDLSRRSLESQFSSPLTIHALSFNIIPTSPSDVKHLWCKEGAGFSLSHYGKYYLSKEGQHLHLLKSQFKIRSNNFQCCFSLKFSVPWTIWAHPIMVISSQVASTKMYLGKVPCYGNIVLGWTIFWCLIALGKIFLVNHCTKMQRR